MWRSFMPISLELELLLLPLLWWPLRGGEGSGELMEGCMSLLCIVSARKTVRAALAKAERSKVPPGPARAACLPDVELGELPASRRRRVAIPENRPSSEERSSDSDQRQRRTEATRKLASSVRTPGDILIACNARGALSDLRVRWT